MMHKQRLKRALFHLGKVEDLLNPKGVVDGSDMLLTSLERTIEEVEYQLAMLEMAESFRAESANQE